VSTNEPAGEPSEEELRAAYEAQIRQLRVEHLVIENVVTLVNLGMRRTGLAPGTEQERDAEQVRLAIESVRAMLPVLEQTAPSQVGPIREALSQLQLAFVRIGSEASGAGGASEPGPGGRGSEPGVGGGPEPGPGDGGSEPGVGGGSEPGAGGGSEPGAGGGQGGPAGGGPPASEPPPAAKPGEPGPAERSGRLWVPGR
jgi:hypothetical protein